MTISLRKYGRVLAVLTFVYLIGACSRQAVEIAGIQGGVDYNWHVRPILADNCFACHGPDSAKREAGLRLDVPDAAYAELPESPGRHAIVRGNPEDSEILRRITATDPDLRMPPVDSHKGALTPEQVAILTRWIDDGAEYKQHWAYIEPKVARAPRSAFNDRVVNDIDRYVFAAQEAREMAPSPEADKETLINRVSLTLTGLPPTLGEVDSFLADESDDAYEKLVDRLLATPAYGEHQASRWLSAARYADSDGFLDDHQDRLLWPYRDWVVKALNDNMAFDDFATLQLAGDLLARPGSDEWKEQTLATTFLRVGKRTTENGAIDEEYRVEYMLDRTDTVGTTFLGLTVGCARCHDHKYDAISARDYYSLAAFFNNVDEPGFYAPGHSGVTAGPTLPWMDAATERRIGAATAAVAERAKAYADATTAAKSAAATASLLADRRAVGARLSAAVQEALLDQYSFENTSPIPDDQLPTSQRRGSTPPELLVRPPVVQTVGIGEGGRPVLITPGAPPGAAPPGVRPVTPPAGPGVRPRRAFNPFNPDGLPADIVRRLIVWSPNTVPGRPPAVLQSPILKPGMRGNALWFDDINKGFLGRDVGYFERTQPFTIDLLVLPAEGYEDATIFNHRDDDNSGGGGYQLHLVNGNQLQFSMMHARAGNMIRIVSDGKLPPGEWAQVTVAYDGSSRASGMTLYVNGEPVALKVERDNLTRTILPKAWAPQLGDEFLGFAFGKRFRVSTLKGGAIDELRLFDRALTPLEVRYLVDPRQAVAEVTPEQLTGFLAATDAAVTTALATLTEARTAENELVSLVPQIMVMGETPEPRQAYVLERGLYNQHGEAVEPAGLASVFPFADELPKNRIGLAQWLFDERNPLTARVIVNRVWQQHFGRGLVETANDFGVQGSVPSHPELLDWLAIRFIESGWDLKALNKIIVMSATYRQSSVVPETLLARDPDNQWLARGIRIRMPAELVRDNALAASGLLKRDLGGPSVYPYQPDGIWDGLSFTPYPGAAALPDDQHHRRSLYSFVKRNAPHPAMAVFDFPDRLAASVQRKTSNTPLQALVLMDDPQYLEAYRALAANAMQAVADADERITHVFRLATRRHPTDPERAAIRDYYDQEIADFTANRDKAGRLLTNGVTSPPQALDVVELAALTNVTAAVMNTPDAYSIR